MNIEQQRMEFEKAFKLKWEIGHFILKMVKFVEESQDYAPVNAVKQMSDEYYWVLALNTGWWAWLAAQQQEGYVMVPVEPSKEKLKEIEEKCFEHPDCFGIDCPLDVIYIAIVGEME